MSQVASALISDDDEFFRMAMRRILSGQLGIEKIEETATFDDAVECLARGDGLELALLDLGMPGMDTRNSIRTLRESFSSTRVAVVSASRRRSDIIESLAAGAHGYVHKGSGAGGIAEALGLICNGTVYVPPFLPEISDQEEPTSRSAEAHRTRDERIVQRLTRRQREVLQLLVEGMSNKSIARQLSLSEGAVKFHLAALFGHFGVSNRVQAATYGARLLEIQRRSD